MGVPLKIATYNEREAHALRHLSNDHIRAFSPVTFMQAGYPFRAEDEHALIRYVDTMQELNNPKAHHETMLYTPAEAEIVRAVCDGVAALTELQMGRRIRPWMGPLATMKLFRAIQHASVVVGRDKLRILEIGPGSGYLGAMLLKCGHHYTSTDIAQGFYVWQSRLMEHMAPGEFHEGVEDEAWPYRRAARALHIPWWDFARLHRSQPPQFDIIVCDHALGEMHVYALRYVPQLARLMLEQAAPGLFMYTSIGAPNVSSEEAVRLNFERVQLDRVISGEISAFAVRGRPLPNGLDQLAVEVPLYDPKRERVRLYGRDFMPIRRDEAPLSYEFYEFIGFDMPSPTD
jgi:hypothetical protein